MPAASLFARVGLTVPGGGGDCVCGEFVRFDLAGPRAAHFLVCPAVDEKVTAGLVGLVIDEDAVRVGMEAFDARNQDRGAEGTVEEPQEGRGRARQRPAGDQQGRGGTGGDRKPNPRARQKRNPS